MNQIDPIERHLFLEGIFLRYGYDFRQYSEVSMNRRLGNLLQRLDKPDLMTLLNEVLKSKEVFDQILPNMTIGTTEFFRDPVFFRDLRDLVFPILQTYPTLKIWSAGCSSGEEVYSLAIALKEEGLLDRSLIFATDLNPAQLKKAKEGIFVADSIPTFNKNYVTAGGKCSPSDYYTSQYGLVRFDPGLRENILFSEHNLVTDSVFGEMHLILCRNVLIYFDRPLQDRVFQLFLESLIYKGFLAVGSKETVRFSNVAKEYEIFSCHDNNIFRSSKHPVRQTVFSERKASR
jgi:chemotaxis protein methyltransferase CheR